MLKLPMCHSLETRMPLALERSGGGVKNLPIGARDAAKRGPLWEGFLTPESGANGGPRGAAQPKLIPTQEKFVA
jgi:hypothetical protein